MPQPSPHFKTKLCFGWQKGACTKGERCTFAHGEHELQPYADDRAEEDWGAEAPKMWLPPGADGAADKRIFAADLDPSFLVPARLATKSSQLVGAVNDFHFAMVNDFDRNEFYKTALKRVLTPESKVLEIGTGSGLLAMLAATIGCKWVVAVEANRHMAELAVQNIHLNGLQHKIRVVSRLSTELQPCDFPSPPDVLVSELFGTLLLGESALDYIHDARTRLLAPKAKVVPPAGCQMATLIECPQLEVITSVTQWGGLDLRFLNALQDTATVVFTKQYGFQFSTMPHTRIAPPIRILEVDFETADPAHLPQEQRFEVVAEHTGTVHAVMLTWEAYAHDGCAMISTDPSRTTFQRDMQWGQALQLVEDLDAGDGTVPLPFTVTKGERVLVIVRYAEDRIVLQFQLRRLPLTTD
eukprot:GGOE01042760.1.p1 GENE.GGOE01042760.1~~GGOE01042760.1.p1  ORF type:complete len:412 (-),score=140.45 GGOE01042760.1:75-1310(-)